VQHPELERDGPALVGPAADVFATAAPAGAQAPPGGIPGNFSEISGHPDDKWAVR
jgi:hypothetical protein